MSDETGMIEKFLEFDPGERPLTHLEVRHSANVGRVKIAKRRCNGEFVLSRSLQNLDSFGRIFGMYFNSSLNGGQKIVLSQGINGRSLIYRICQFLSPRSLACPRKGKGQYAGCGTMLRSLQTLFRQL